MSRLVRFNCASPPKSYFFPRVYLLQTPAWLRKLYAPGALWEGPPTAEPTVYLTFDDGPHPEVTRFVLEQLDRYDASATFFCIGKNVVEHPGLYERLTRSRHAVGNHTHNHLNGSKVGTENYLADVGQAALHIESSLFRPPYGRIRRAQAKLLQEKAPFYRIVMWSLLSADFDAELTPRKCLENVVFHAQPRHIIVFHDSLKAAPRLEYALPRALEHFHRNGWRMSALSQRAE